MSRGKVRTMTPGGTGVRYLGELGPVFGLRYGFTIPGGCDQLTCSLGISQMMRTEALDPGRLVQVLYGGSVVWEGILDEPQQADVGWTITAHGSGTWGADWLVYYTGAWAGAATMNTIMSNAISRGLKWISSIDFPLVGGLWTGDKVDPGAGTIDGMLNSACSYGGLTWWVRRGVEGNRLNIGSLPGTPTRLLACTVPAPRTLGGDINAIAVRYQSAPEMSEGYPAQFATYWCTDNDSIARHGRKEAFVDVSPAGTITQGDASDLGYYVLSQYKRANYAGPFTARYGQLTTKGGSPQDLAVYWYEAEGPMVVRLMLADQAWGGEVTAGPVSFLVGKYEYDDGADEATITPFNYLRADLASFLTNQARVVRGRATVINTSGKRPTWRFR